MVYFTLMDLDDELCFCFHVTKRKIVNFVKQTRPRRSSQISQCFGAGTGCGWCIPFLVKVHAQALAGGNAFEDNMTPEEYGALRAAYRQSVAEGSRERNTHEAAGGCREGADPSASAGAEPETETEKAPETPQEQAPKEGAFDYTSYFSRSRPEPEPETLKPPGR
ncbi:MAG TPA: (2Fe-2S)-binding protein [Planctomycetota bacterium]|nr:(2Fe-2S)-binding protein [Planctomycetota bacterium]